MTKLKNKSAFTLIELLVVIAIIGILSTLAVVALQNARKSARDAKRIADIKQIQTALELYFNDNGSYPASVTSTIATSGQIYMAVYPTAPSPADGDCADENNAYVYTSNGATYSIVFCLGSNVSGLSAGIKDATPNGISVYVAPPFVCGNIFTDSRDSQQYPTVLIGSQCWMAKNMNYDNGCTSKAWVNGSDVGWCGCYSNSAGNCTTYGKLYQWSAAMASSTTEGVQGICPEGWHIPTSAEQSALNTYLNTQTQYLCSGIGGYNAKSLAANSGWTSDMNNCNPGGAQSSNNLTGFNGLPSGYRIDSSGAFNYVGQYTFFWSSSFSSPYALARSLRYNGSGFYSSTTYYPVNGFSVRCLKN